MGRKLDELKVALKNVTTKTVEGDTLGEALNNFNLQYVDVVVTLSVKSGTTAVTGSTITLKTGTTAGSGTAQTAESDGSYKLKTGKYNYSVAKSGYTTKTGTFEVTTDDAKAGAKTVAVAVVAA